MKKKFKYLILFLSSVVILFLIFISVMVYKVKYGFPIYEKTPPELKIDSLNFNILVFSKTNGFAHNDAIDKANSFFRILERNNNWKFTFSNNGAVFNKKQLNNFNLVIWNNVSGRTLNTAQRNAFKEYMEKKGNFLGIHAAGDDSHHWDWYYEKLIGAIFSHHSLDPHIQKATIINKSFDSIYNKNIIPYRWEHYDEWYVFFNNPKEKNAKILYSIDGNTIISNGNISFIVKDKDFGMGKDHPVIWYKCFENGNTSVYSSLGHNKESFQNTNYQNVLENIILSIEQKKGLCN